mmetsp:Transcript_3080/g.9167  ORF Transcript_3080/g.9167 Transcript_3080/m.9167 type:complete len:239 (+) Transcript_3080:283-999(+)
MKRHGALWRVPEHLAEMLATSEAAPRRWLQARVAVYGSGEAGVWRKGLRKLFDGWEDEAMATVKRTEAMEKQGGKAAADAWAAQKRARSLRQSGFFTQMLLGACHRDVVLWAQTKALKNVLRPEDFDLSKFHAKHAVAASEKRLHRRDVQAVVRNHLEFWDGALPREFVAECRREAEALDRLGRLKPPTMHRVRGCAGTNRWAGRPRVQERDSTRGGAVKFGYHTGARGPARPHDGAR